MSELLDGVGDHTVDDHTMVPTGTTDHAPAKTASLAELNNRLNQAYLSGDGAAVERVMALIEANQRRSSLAPV